MTRFACFYYVNYNENKNIASTIQKTQKPQTQMGFTWCTLLGCLLMLQKKKRILKFWILVFSAGYFSHKSEMVDGYLDNCVSNELTEAVTNPNS